MATRFEADPVRKKARRDFIVASEPFGVLEGLKGGADRLNELLAQLEAEGYLERIERHWKEGAYDYPAPTEKAWERIAEGRLFGATELAT